MCIRTHNIRLAYITFYNHTHTYTTLVYTLLFSLVPTPYYNREALVATLQSSTAACSEPIQLQQLLHLICYDLYNKHYQKAFSYLTDPSTLLIVLTLETSLDTYVTEKTLKPEELHTLHVNLSLYNELVGKYIIFIYIHLVVFT